MKNFHIKWLGVVFLWLFVVGEIIAQNATVTRVEYFIDNDPGVGNGTEVTITPGVTVAQTFQVPLSSLSLTDGIHRLSVRVKDSNNKWSWVANALFVKERITNTAAPINITKIEYFFNLDPGSGNGIDVPITPATSLTNFGFTAPMPSLPIGFNYLSVRVKDARNGWTRSITRPFLKEELASNKVLPNITQIEYFLDEDPGPGNGSPLTFTAGTTVNNLSFTIPMPTTLSAGIHTFSVRAKDANNKWSIITTRAFIKENIPSATPLPAISRLEYFFDNDPGVGNGTSINFTAGTTVNDLSFDVPLPNALSSGLHKLTVRARDNKGKWSTTVVRTIYKENATVTALPNVNRLEYFIDTDPGVGNGTNIPITANTTLTNINFTAPLTGLQNGKHFMEIRARDANNKWSMVAVREFVVCTNPFTAAISPATEQNTCDGTPVILSVPTGYSYQWRLNGADIYNASANTLAATQSGDYTVIVAKNGCLFTTNPVRVNSTTTPSPPTITTLDQTICSGQKVTLESSNCSGLVTWSNGSTGGAIVVAPTTTTTYTANCKIANCVSANSSTSCVVTVNAALAAPTIAGPASAVCQSSNVTLTASGCAGIVTWNSGQTGSALSFVATTAGTYSAICSSGVCTSVSSSTFTVSLINSTAKNVVLTASNAKICSGQSTTLTASGCSGTIAWSSGNTTSTITVSPTTTGTYSATCTHNGCSSVSANTLKIDVSPIPSAPVVYGQSQTICKGTSVSLSAYFCIGGTINWSNGFVGQTQTVKPETTTVYRATCTKDGCASANSNAVTITVSECQNPAVNITKIEYFIDNDPGMDNGTNVPITSASVLNNFSFSIPIQASFADGYHLLSVRAKDSNNKWSWTAIKPFWKEALPSIPASTNIVKLEYFIDNDPGTDNGSNIPITAGTSVNNLAVTIPLDNTLVKGVHILTLRAKDANGKWSTALVRSFYKDDLPQISNLANIVRLEYFIDTDPGFEFGTEIPITANSTISNIPLIINMSGLSQGEHYLEIRAKDADGKWSTVGIKQFRNGTNKINIGSVSAELCGQSTFSLPYTLEGTFNAGNTLTVQLLDVNNNVVNGNLFSQVATTNGTLAVPLPNVGVNTIYKFRIVSSDPAIMSDPVQFTLKPTTIPTIAASGQTTFCSGGSVLLTSSNCSGTIVWSNGITNNMISVTTSGTYSATCNMPNACSFVSSNSIVVDILGGGASAPTVSGTTSICGVNNTTVLTAAGCSGGSFNWYLVPTGGASQYNGNPYTTPPLASTSTFYVSCSIGGCESNRTPVTVTVTPTPPQPSISPTNPPAICAGQSVSLTANGCSGLITWSNGATGSTTSVSPTVTTTYTANCRINGCIGSNSSPVIVTITTTCNYPITVRPSRVLVCPNTPTTLTATGCPNTITWTGGATGSSVTITPAVTGTYTATCAAGGSGNIVVTVGATTAALTSTDNIQTGTAKFQVTQVITSSSLIGNSAINPKPNVLYQAGKSILLQPGFSTTTGSIFSAKIQGCN